MTNTTHSFDRQPNESDFTWQSRVKKHIRRDAPKEYRYYIRDGKPGAKGQRWILPGAFVAIGLFFAFAGYSNDADVRNLNSTNGQQGEFIVENLQKRYSDTKNAKDPYYVPIVTIRGESVVPLFSKDRQFEVGDIITLRYAQQGPIAAAFTDDDGKVSNGGSIVLVIMGMIFVAIGVLVGKYYRGAVDSTYIDEEFVKLTKTTKS